MKMQTYQIELFDSKNTSLNRRYSGKKPSEYAKDLSTKEGVYKVIIYNTKKAFEEFEAGSLTSWSYPNGLGQIKINS